LKDVLDKDELFEVFVRLGYL
jgi:hypothetical protein